MKEEEIQVPEWIKDTVSPEAYEDQLLFHTTRREMANMGLRPPTWIEWIREWSFIDNDAARKPL